MSTEKLHKEYDITLQWRAFPLHPETPEEGSLITELFAGRPVNIPNMMQKLHKTAEELGLPFGDLVKTFNSRLAQELGLWAGTQNKGEEFHSAAFRAYFVDGKNIGNIPVLLDLAASVNLPVEAATQVLEDRTFKAAVDRDWALAREKEIQVVPTFVANGEKLVGAKPYEVLAKFIETNGAGKRL